MSERMYFNRLGYSLSAGQEVELRFNFILPNGDELDIGDVGTVVEVDADFVKIWGVDFGVNTGIVGEREGYGEAYVIEHVKPRNLHKEEKPETGEVLQAMYNAGLLTAPPPAKTVMPKLLAKLGEIAETVDAEERASNEALELGGISIRNKAGVAFGNSCKVTFWRGMDGIAEGGDKGLIWFDKADAGWVLDLDAGGSVFISEVREVLDALEVDECPAPLDCAPAKLGGVGNLVTDMYKDSGMTEE